MNKKGSIVDGFENLIWLFTSVLILIAVSFAVVTITENMQDKEGFDTPAIEPFWTTLAQTPVFMDWAVLLVTLVMIGGSMLVYYFVDMQPFMYVLSWLLTIVLTIVIIIIGSSLAIVLNAFPTIVAQMLFIPFLISNFHWIALIYFVLSLITLHIPK